MKFIHFITMIISLQERVTTSIEKSLEFLTSLGYRLVKVENTKGLKKWNCFNEESEKISAQFTVTELKNKKIEFKVKFDAGDKLLNRELSKEQRKRAGIIRDNWNAPFKSVRFTELAHDHRGVLGLGIFDKPQLTDYSYAFFIDPEEFLN